MTKETKYQIQEIAKNSIQNAVDFELIVDRAYNDMQDILDIEGIRVDEDEMDTIFDAVLDSMIKNKTLIK